MPRTQPNKRVPKPRSTRSPQPKRNLTALCKAAVLIVKSQQIEPQASAQTGINKRRRPHNMSPEERRLSLVNDIWVLDGSVTEDTVVCRACRETYCLDDRGFFYAGFWTKHKGRCRVIRLAEIMSQGFTEAEAKKILKEQAKARREAKRKAQVVKEAIKQANPKRRTRSMTNAKSSTRARKIKSPTPPAAKPTASGRTIKSKSPKPTTANLNASRRALRSNSGTPIVVTVETSIESSRVCNGIAKTTLAQPSTSESDISCITARRKGFHLNDTNETPRLKAMSLPGNDTLLIARSHQVFSPPHSPSPPSISYKGNFLCPLYPVSAPQNVVASAPGTSAYRLAAVDWSNVARPSSPFGL